MQLDELLEWMQGRSVTLGWNSIVSYDRSRVNKLLEYQYVTKTGDDNVLPPISGSEPLAGGTSMEFSNLVFGKPLLSFENASLSHARAKLTMPFVSGAFAEVSGYEPVLHVSKYSGIVPGSSYTLSMEIPLEEAPGEIGEQGEVLLDISQGNDFRVNFVEEEAAQKKIGEFFKLRYDSAPDEVKRYQLSMLDKQGNAALTPVSFHVRTQPAPGNKTLGSSDYGDGAIVLFIKTSCSTSDPDGTLPTDSSNFQYLIPSNTGEDGQDLYSGTVLISNKTVMKYLVAPYYMSICSNLQFDIKNGNSNDQLCELRAQEGGTYSAGGVKVEWSLQIPPTYFLQTHYAVSGRTESTVPGPLELPCQDMSFIPINNGLRSNWARTYDQQFTDISYDKYGSQTSYERITIQFSNSSDLQVKMNAGNIVSFDPLGGNHTTVAVYNDGWIGVNSAQQRSVREQITEQVEISVQSFNNCRIPGIDLFTLANLLFPEKNTLQLNEAFLPGDLACFGQLDTEKSTYRLMPLLPTVVVTGSEQFVLQPPVGNGQTVSWSVQSIDAGPAGIIDTNGRYQAPSDIESAQTSHRDMVIATIDAGTPQTRTAASVIEVVRSSISVFPAFAQTMSNSGAVVMLRANAIASGAVSLTWTLEGPGSLQASPDNNLEACYVPPEAADMNASIVRMATIRVSDTVSGSSASSSIVILKSGNTFNYQVDPYLTPALGPSQTQQIKLYYNGMEDLPDMDGLEWIVSPSTAGTIDRTSGVYTAPAVIRDSCAVVVAVANFGRFSCQGYCVIPLAG